MPCYTISTTQVDFSNVPLDKLAEAMVASGWQKGFDANVFYKGTVTVRFTKGGQAKITGREGVDDLNAIGVQLKQAYGKHVVLDQAKKKGWKVEQDPVNPNKLRVRAR